MAELTVPLMNFSALGQLGSVYRKAQEDEMRKQTLASLGQGTEADAASLLKSGDLSLAQLGVAMRNRNSDDIWRQQEAQRAQQNSDRGFGFQQSEAQRAQQNADRGYGLQERTATRLEDRTPPNYEQNPEQPGAIRPMAGGPADPAQKVAAAQSQFEAEINQRKKAADLAGLAQGTPEYQQFVATGSYSRPKPRDLPSTVVKDMNEKGGTLEDFTRLKTGFKEEYGGFKTQFAGDTVNAIARNTGIGNEERSTWWQDYQNQKNVVRNRLFGSALTATEKAEFDKANIHPGMTPGTIKANLALQHDAARRAAAKLVNTYSKMGYSQDQIEAATGFPLSDLQAPAIPSEKPAPQAKGVISFTDYFRQ
jgi:hypothetical protein